MATPEKEKAVEELNEIFSKAKSAVLANYQGISAAEMTSLRTYMRDRAVLFKVIKNTLARQAAKNTPFEVLDPNLKGPVSLVASYDDVIAPAKALADYAKTDAENNPKILCGVLEGEVISPEKVKELASLPSKEVLLSKLLATMQGPTTNFVGVFHSLLRKLVGTLDAVRDKKAGSQ